MREKGVAEALLRERLPPALVSHFAGPPVMLAESFVDAALKGRAADVVLRVPLDSGERAHVYCLVEHKRTEERFVLMQVLRYLTELYELLSRSGTERVPIVIPILIYNGSSPWRGPRRFSDLLDAPESVKRLSIDFEVTLLDVGAVSVNELSSHPTLKGGLLGLKAAASPPDAVGKIIRHMLRALEDDPSTLDLFLRYLLNVSGKEMLRIAARELSRLKGKEKTMVTIEQFLVGRGYKRGKRHGLKQGLEQGLEQGIEQGFERGLEQSREALRAAVYKVLVRRFKRVPAAAKEQLASADFATLTQWVETAATAKTLKDVFRAH